MKKYLLELHKKKNCDIFYMALDNEESNLFISKDEIIEFSFFSLHFFYVNVCLYFNAELNESLKIDANVDQDFYEFLNTNYTELKNLYPVEHEIKKEKNNKVAASFTHHVFVYFDYHLNENLNLQTAFQTINKWMINKVDEEISVFKKSNKIILINNSEINNFINKNCFNSYEEKVIENHLKKESKKSKPTITISAIDERKDDLIYGYNITKEDAEKNDFVIIGDDQYEAEYIENMLKYDYNAKVENRVAKDNIYEHYEEFFKKKIKRYKDNKFEYINIKNLRALFDRHFIFETNKINFQDLDLNYFIDAADKINKNDLKIPQLLIDLGPSDYREYLNLLIKYLSTCLKNNKFEEFRSLSILFLHITSLWNGSELFPFYFYNHFIDLVRIFVGKNNMQSKFEPFLISYKIFLFEVFFIYRNTIDNDDENNIIFKDFSKEYNDLVKYKIRLKSSDLRALCEFLGIGNEAIWTSPFFSKFEVITETLTSEFFRVKSFLKNGGEDYLQHCSNFISNHDARILFMTVTLYDVTRKLIYDDKWLHNNEIIEELISFSESIIDHFADNLDNYHVGGYHRLISLISAKNNLKLRYNIDNNKWDNRELIDKYKQETFFVLDNNLHMANLNTVVKAVEEVGKIQDAYNYFNIHESLENRFYKEFNKMNLVAACLRTEVYSEAFDMDEDFFKYCEGEYYMSKYIIHSRRLLPFTEFAAAAASVVTYYGPKMYKLMEDHVNLTFDYKNLTNIYWNVFDSEEKGRSLNNKVIIEKNSNEMRHVYDV